MRETKRSVPSSQQEITPCWDQHHPEFMENGDNSFLKPSCPGTGSAEAQPKATMVCLLKTLEAEIIPRLMAAYPNGGGSGPGGPAVSMLQEQDVHDFTDIVMKGESAPCMKYIEAIRDRGVSLQSIYLELLTPAARKLGLMWESDACDFTQITVALWRMQQAMYDLSPDFHADPELVLGEQKKIMLTPVPGSQHTLGILMVAEFFRRAGWGVWSEPACSRERLLQEVRGQRFDAVGISVGSEAQIPGMESFIDDLRRQSKNKSLVVMVGGPVFVNDPNLANELGADATAMDAESAVEKTEMLLAARNPKGFAEMRVQRVG